MSNIFSSAAYWSFVYLLLRSIYPSPLSIFNGAVVFSCLRIIGLLYILDLESLVRHMICNGSSLADSKRAKCSLCRDWSLAIVGTHSLTLPAVFPDSLCSALVLDSLGTQILKCYNSWLWGAHGLLVEIGLDSSCYYIEDVPVLE